MKNKKHTKHPCLWVVFTLIGLWFIGSMCSTNNGTNSNSSSNNGGWAYRNTPQTTRATAQTTTASPKQFTPPSNGASCTAVPTDGYYYERKAYNDCLPARCHGKISNIGDKDNLNRRLYDCLYFKTEHMCKRFEAYKHKLAKRKRDKTCTDWLCDVGVSDIKWLDVELKDHDTFSTIEDGTVKSLLAYVAAYNNPTFMSFTDIAPRY